MTQKVEKVHFWHIKCTSMKHILALLSWGQIWIVYELWAFTFDKMEVGHPVSGNNFWAKLCGTFSDFGKLLTLQN